MLLLLLLSSLSSLLLSFIILVIAVLLLLLMQLFLLSLSPLYFYSPAEVPVGGVLGAEARETRPQYSWTNCQVGHCNGLLTIVG